jgi:hypothetical protein
MESVHRSASHQRTLGTLFQHPLTHNIEWREVVSLFESLGSAVEGGHETLHVTINKQTIVLHPPKHKGLSEDLVMQIRHFLMRAGVEPPHPDKGPNSDPPPA